MRRLANIAMPMMASVTVSSTMTDLSPSQNRRLKQALAEELRKYPSITALAQAMGIKQPSLSKILNGVGGASHRTAEAFAKLRGRPVEEILGPRFDSGPPPPPDQRLAIFEEAARLVRDEYPEAYMEHQRQLAATGGAERTGTEWILKLASDFAQWRRENAVETTAVRVTPHSKKKPATADHTSTATLRPHGVRGKKAKGG